MHRLQALAVFQILASIGVVAWWVYWFASGSYHHGAACDLVYENSFPPADLALAAFVLAAAIQTLRRHRSALVLGFFGAGMALDLAVLDTTHNLYTHAFDAPVLTIIQKLVFAVVNGLIGLLTLVTLTRHRADFPGAGNGRPTKLASGLSGVVAALTVGGGALYLLAVSDRPECAMDVEIPLLAPAALVGVLGLLGALGLSGRPTRPLTLATGGALLHAGGVGLLYGIENADLFVGPLRLVVAGAAVAGALALLVASMGRSPA